MNGYKSPKPTSADRLRVAAVQMRFAPTIEENLVSIQGAVIDAVRRHADVVLFPECAVTGYAYDFDVLTPKCLRDALFRKPIIAKQSVSPTSSDCRT